MIKIPIKRTMLGALLCLAVWLPAQHQVRGTVTSDEGPLIGVNILIKSTAQGTITDFDGTYELNVPSGQDTLIFSYTGYNTLELPVNGRTVIDVNMSFRAEMIEEIVVVGYGVQRKSDMTGAVSTLQSRDITNIPTPIVGQALQGKVAGVQVTPRSGAPGADAVIRIRGVGTLNDADPLFVVDGMIVKDISFINPQDIENISVLKDASATAIYGARGANGVVIVTTRRGKTGQAGQISLSSYYGSQEVIRKIDLTNAREYAILANELSVNEGRPPLYPNPDAFGQGTDWQDVIFRDAPIQSHQLSFTGGTDRMSYFASANYFRQSGIVRGSDFERFTARINNEYKIKDYLSIGHNVALIYTRNDFAAGVLGSAYRSDPLTPPRDSTGAFGNTANKSSTANAEASIFYNQTNYSNGYRAVSNIYLDLKFLKYLTFRTNLGIDFEFNEGKSFVPVFVVSSIQQNLENQLNINTSRNRNWLWENTLTYNRDWKNHHLDVLAGITTQDNIGEFLVASRKNFIAETPEQFYLNAGEQGTESVGNGIGGNGDWGMLSYLFRVNYTLMDRYLFTFSSRADGSSRFGENNRYGFFPSFALGWNLTNEAFMQSQQLFSRMKLRAGWGRTGNDRIGDYNYTTLVNLNQPAVFGPGEVLNTGATVLSLANPDLRWEETEQWNAGVEMGFFDNRLQAEVDYYRRVSDGILYRAPIPDYLGADPAVRNISTVLNRGWDVTLNWRQTAGKLTYSIGGVLSTIYNEVLKIDNQNGFVLGGGLGVGGQRGTRSEKGRPIGSFYGYQVAGVFQNAADLEKYPQLGRQVPGDLRFADTNGDGLLNPDDRVFLGSPIPNLIYGFNAGLEYGGFDFMIEFNGQSGNEVVNAKKMARFGLYNFERSFLDRWNGEGTSNTEPRVTTSGINYEFSDRFVEDGSFLRLRSLVLGYTLPQKIAQRLYLGNLRVYVSGTNIQTWQQFSGYTPEIFNNSVFDAGIDNGVYPLAKTYLVGLDIRF